MRIGSWIGPPSRAILLVAVGAAGAGAAIAVASVADSSGVIHACVSEIKGAPVTTSGNIRIIDPSATPAQTCVTNQAGGPSEVPISWNTVGQQGSTGPPGPTGLQGPPGLQGLQGRTLTISGETFTIGGTNRIATVQSPPTIAPLPVKPGGKPVADLSLDLGGSPSTIEILSWSVSADQSGTTSRGSGGGAGKTNVHEIQITKKVDKASPLLFKACVAGKHIKSATLVVRKAGGQAYLTIKLTNVLISSYQTSNGSGDRPTESLSLNFTKIEYSSSH